MEKRWNVYHGADYLGLKTAKEIREALRQGTLDPFDKVSREGSNIREDLIEVDEIFREGQDGAEESVPVAAAPPKPMAAPMTQQQADLKVQGNLAMKPTPMAAPSTSYEEADDEEDEEGNFGARNDTGTRNSGKRYYLIDRDKVLGPLSALEIQSLYNRNMLNKKVRVQKIGSEKTIPIAQFISSYSGDRLKELQEDGRIPQAIGVGSPSSKVMNELAKMANSRRMAQNRRNRTYFLMTLIGLILGAIVYFVYEQSQHESAPSREERMEDEEDPSAASETKGSKSRPRLIQKPPEVPKKKPEKPRDEASLAPDANRNSQVNRPTKRTEAPPPTQARPPSSPVQEGPISKAIEMAGRLQTIGPLAFNVPTLEACPAKCTLTLNDATGARVRAVFFKNAYFEQLKARSRSVYITGNTKVERGELTIFIQDIR